MSEKLTTRNQEIADVYVKGDTTLQVIGNLYGVSRERIRQLVKEIYPKYTKPKKYYPTLEEKIEAKKLRGISRFWARTKHDPNTGCLEWQGGLFLKTGYGKCNLEFSTGLSTHYTHRLAWFLVNGSLPENLAVLHKCDNPKCVNTHHLYLGTMRENMQDREERFKGISPMNRDKTKTPRRAVSNETLTQSP